MKFENLTRLDRESVKAIHAKSNLYPFPNLDSPLYCIQKLIRDDEDKIVGAYLFHITSEISLILDPDMNKLDRAKAIVRMVDQMQEDCLKMGICDVHVFSMDTTFAEFLIKNIKFVKAKGIALYRKVLNNE